MIMLLADDEGGGGIGEPTAPPDHKSKKGRSGLHKKICASHRGEPCDCRQPAAQMPPAPPSAAGGTQAADTLAAIEAGKSKALQTKLAEAEDALARERQLRAKSERVLNATRKVSTPGRPKKSLWDTIVDAVSNPMDI